MFVLSNFGVVSLTRGLGAEDWGWFYGRTMVLIMTVVTLDYGNS